jgi:hypothetical protein
MSSRTNPGCRRRERHSQPARGDSQRGRLRRVLDRQCRAEAGAQHAGASTTTTLCCSTSGCRTPTASSLLREWSDSEQIRPCPVVMMSGHGTVETAVEATRLGAFDFIEKPVSLAKLLRTVERALESARPTGARVGRSCPRRHRARGSKPRDAGAPRAIRAHCRARHAGADHRAKPARDASPLRTSFMRSGRSPRPLRPAGGKRAAGGRCRGGCCSGAPGGSGSRARLPRARRATALSS